MLRFSLDSQHEDEDSIKVDILAPDERGQHSLIAATFYMTKRDFLQFVEDGVKWFDWIHLPEGLGNKEYEAAKEKAKQVSEIHSCVQHVNRRLDGSYHVSDWLEHDGTTVVSYEQGREL
jgi:hypothetical protein